MPAPGGGGTAASQGGFQGAMAATTGAIGGAAGAVKSGAVKMFDWATPDSKPRKDSDPISLAGPTGNPTPELFVAMADMQEKAGNVEQAKKHYEAALKQNPKHADSLIGLGHLLDRQGKLKEATDKYQLAAKHHPRDARVWNDLGLCLARQKKQSESVAALTKAVELEPKKQLYRNNLATVLTESGRNDEALAQLTAAHGPAVAHYNLGYLLYQKGNKTLAAEHFSQAATLDPAFSAAQNWARIAAAESTGAPPQAQVAAAGAAPAPQPALTNQSTERSARESYYRNYLRQPGSEPPVAEVGYLGQPTPDFTQARVATSPRPLPPVESDEGPPTSRQ
jgi:Tfp pilus assembly protein PilF